MRAEIFMLRLELMARTEGIRHRSTAPFMPVTFEANVRPVFARHKSGTGRAQKAG